VDWLMSCKSKFNNYLCGLRTIDLASTENALPAWLAALLSPLTRFQGGLGV